MQVTEGVVKTVNSILSVDLASDNRDSASALSQITKSVEEQVAYTIKQYGKFSSVKPNVAVEGVAVDKTDKTGGIGFAVSQTDAGFGEGASFDPDQKQAEGAIVGSTIQLPNEALSKNGNVSGE